MKIGIEAQRIFRQKKHGMDMVALELIKRLQEIDKTNDYYIFIKPDIDNKCLTETPNFKIVELSGGPYPSWEQYALPKAAKRYGCDLLHCTSNTGPLYSKMPLVITLHDIIYLESLRLFKNGGTLYQKFGNIYRRLIVPPIVKKCNKLITVSQFEKKRIDEHFNMTGDKLVAIYNGVSDHFRNEYTSNEIETIKTKYKLPEKYFFFLGNTDPKKNTKGVLKAYHSYCEKYGYTHKLVMLDYDISELKKLLFEINASKLIDYIFLTGYVENIDLPIIYNQSSLFLYPSLRESFGIPLLEAMCSGVAVITSNTSSMPEIAGDAALIIDPYKPEQIADAIHKIESDPALKDSLIEKGLQQSKKFTWNKMAENVLKLYQEVYSENHN